MLFTDLVWSKVIGQNLQPQYISEVTPKTYVVVSPCKKLLVLVYCYNTMLNTAFTIVAVDDSLHEVEPLLLCWPRGTL